MKVIIAAIAAITTMATFTGAAIADVSINIRFGSTPTYRSNIYRSPLVPSYQNNYDNYRHNRNSRVIVREIPSSSYYRRSSNYGLPRTFIERSNVYEHGYNNYYGDRYIIEKRIIRVR